MKQAKELGDLCNFCLEEYRWAPFPPDPLREKTEEQHHDCIAKSGELDLLEGEIIADLVRGGLYARPTAPVSPPSQKTAWENVHALVTKHCWFSSGLAASFALTIVDRPLHEPLLAALTGTVIAASVDSCNASPEFFKNVENVFHSLIKSTPNLAFPLACTLGATAKLSGYQGGWIPPLLGIAGLVNLYATKKCVISCPLMLPETSKLFYAYWRAGPVTGILPSVVCGVVSSFFQSPKASIGLSAAIWATHAAASYSFYLSERHR